MVISTDKSRYQSYYQSNYQRYFSNSITWPVAICQYPWLFVLVVVIAFSLNGKPVLAQGQIIDVAVTGETAPGSLPGAFFDFDIPRLNENGNVIFNGHDFGATGAGIYHHDFISENLVQIVDRGQSLPSGPGVYLSFESINLTENDAGLFLANLGLGAPSATGYYQATYPNQPTAIAVEGNPAPLGGTFGELVAFQSNAQGSLFFENQIQFPTGDIDAIFRYTANSIQRIARYSQLVSGGNGNFQSFSAKDINDNDTVAFAAQLMNTDNGIDDDSGIYFATAGMPFEIAREGQPLPVGPGEFGQMASLSGFLPFAFALNNLNQVTFFANHAGPAQGDWGIYFADDQGNLDRVIYEGQTMPSGVGAIFLVALSKPNLNDNGQLLLSVQVAGTFENAFLLYDSGSLLELTRTGDLAADGNGSLNQLFPRGFTDGGQFAYLANLNGTVAGDADNQGIFMSDGNETIVVDRKGELLNGSPITTLSPAAENSLNGFGQMAYRVETGDGNLAVRLFTPDLHWRDAAIGLWDNDNNWTISLTPAFVHNVFIDPPFNANVFGPFANTHVQQLVIGGPGGVSMELIENVAITVDNGVAVNPNAELTGTGIINGNVSVRGALRPSNGAAEFGIIDIQGHLSLLNSELEFDLAGTQTGDFDQILVRGDLILDGQLTVNVDPLLALGPDMQFTIIDHTADPMNLPIGQFNGLPEGALVGNYNGTNLFITYAGGDCNDVVLYSTIPAPMLGDVNDDGEINLLDVEPFVDLLTSGQYMAEADMNQDCYVNLLDVQLFVTALIGS